MDSGDSVGLSARRPKSAIKKRNSFLVPTSSPRTPINPNLNDSICIDELYLPAEAATPTSQGVVMFADFSEMTIVADLTDENDDLFYNEEQLAEFRHEAFLESCGLGEEFLHL
mmetsp:Transcript_8641/g.20759  ORF Transcript_8641/g.20759 Transcript_8641/m.20759 type:complete len:113 (-) Transcript_8641:41-379(-)